MSVDDEREPERLGIERDRFVSIADREIHSAYLRELEHPFPLDRRTIPLNEASSEAAPWTSAV
jgi:hypothetical protein